MKNTITSIIIAILACTFQAKAQTVLYPCGWDMLYSSITYGQNFRIPARYGLSYNPTTDSFTVSITYDTTVAPGLQLGSFFLGPGAQVTVISNDGYAPSTAAGLRIVNMPYSFANQQTFDDDLVAPFPFPINQFPTASAGKEYHVFGVSANLEQTGIVQNVPLPLFTFKGRGCLDTIYLLEQTDSGGMALRSKYGHNYPNAAPTAIPATGRLHSKDRYCGNAGGSYIRFALPNGINENYLTTAAAPVNGDVLGNEYATTAPDSAFWVSRNQLSVLRTGSSNAAYDALLTLNMNGNFVFNTPATPTSGTYSFNYQYATACGQLKTAQALLTWGAPLPVDIVSFTARKNGQAVQLTWNIANEERIQHYSVERSANGADFKQLATVDAAAKDVYQYTDSKPTDGANQYRLRITDAAGNVTYSKITGVQFAATVANVTIHPLPFSSELNINLNTSTDTKAIITLHDITGRNAGNHTTQLRAGANSMTMNALDALAPGVYVLKIQTGENVQQVRVTKK